MRAGRGGVLFQAATGGGKPHFRRKNKWCIHPKTLANKGFRVNDRVKKWVLYFPYGKMTPLDK